MRFFCFISLSLAASCATPNAKPFAAPVSFRQAPAPQYQEAEKSQYEQDLETIGRRP